MSAPKSATNQIAILRRFYANAASNNPEASKGKDFTQMCAKSRTHLPQNLRTSLLRASGKPSPHPESAAADMAETLVRIDREHAQ